MDTEPRIIFEHHPASGRSPSVFGSYQESVQHATGSFSDFYSDDEPWSPYPTLADFDLAEFVKEHRLSAAAVDSLLKRLHNVWTYPDSCRVTMRYSTEVDQYTKAAVPDRAKVGARRA